MTLEELDKLIAERASELQCLEEQRYSLVSVKMEEDYAKIEELRRGRLVLLREECQGYSLEQVVKTVSGKYEKPNNNLINILKDVREVTGLGLKEAKEAVDTWRTRQ